MDDLLPIVRYGHARAEYQAVKHGSDYWRGQADAYQAMLDVLEAQTIDLREKQ